MMFWELCIVVVVALTNDRSFGNCGLSVKRSRCRFLSVQSSMHSAVAV